MEITTPDASWSFRALSPGLIGCEQLHHCPHARLLSDATGPHWILSVSLVESGQLAYRSGDEWIVPLGPLYAAFLPPYSVVQCEAQGLHVRHLMLISRHAPPVDAPREPVIFTPPSGPPPVSLAQAAALLAGGTDFRPIARQPRPSPLVRRAKAALDASFREPGGIAQLAARLGVPHASLTRRFRGELGVAPAPYRTSLRVMCAAMALLEGEAISATAFGVGFGDIGRFYKQFKATTAVTPARYRTPPVTVSAGAPAGSPPPAPGPGSSPSPGRAPRPRA